MNKLNIFLLIIFSITILFNIFILIQAVNNLQNTSQKIINDLNQMQGEILINKLKELKENK